MFRTLLSITSLAALATGARAELPQLLVPQDYATIQAAADAVATGEEIVISAGTYPESVTFTGKSTVNITCKGKVVIAPPSGDGLTLDGCDNVFIQNLRVKGGALGIRLVDCEQITFLKGGVEATTSHGIRLQGGTGSILQQLTIRDAGEDAINLAVGSLDFTDGTSIVSCKLINPGRDGVGINGSFNHVELCKITGACRDGVTIDNTTPGDENVIKDTKIIKPARHGILIRGNDTHVEACRISAPGGNGLDFAGGTVGFVQDSSFSKCGDHGIVLWGNHMTLDANKIARPLHDGVFASGANHIVQDCTVSGAGTNGFEIVGTGGDYTGNTSVRAKLDGFLLTGTGNTLSANTAKGSKGFDLDNLAPGDNTVEPDNNFKKTGP